ncbi:DUF4236 domain-containing protein [Desulfitobacterium sp. Sab5]|uniref:DUF4236 domain-containing protein n=1 Tax=Desulfitobacterium nosdiversum TaxID=3375356 RepID=UPI003CF937F9
MKSGDFMGSRFRKQIGPKGFKLNIGKKGITSTSVKIAKGITYNSKRGLTLGIPGTGFSYNFGRKKDNKNYLGTHSERQIANQVNLFSSEYTKGWREFTGGYNKKALIASGICIALCFTPLLPLGLVLSIPSLLWLAIDTLIKVIKYNKHLKTSPILSEVSYPPIETPSVVNSIQKVNQVSETKQPKTESFTFRVAGISDDKIQRAIKHNLVEEYLENNEAYDGMTNKEILEDYADETYQVDVYGDSEITLIPEPENTYNHKAIRIEHEDIGKVGYVPDKNLSKVHEILDRNNYNLEWRLIGGKFKQIEYNDEKDKDVVVVKEHTYGIEITLTEKMP